MGEPHDQPKRCTVPVRITLFRSCLRRLSPKAQRSALRLGVGSNVTGFYWAVMAHFHLSTTSAPERGPATVPDLYPSFTHARQGSEVYKQAAD